MKTGWLVSQLIRVIHQLSKTTCRPIPDNEGASHSAEVFTEKQKEFA